MILAGQSEKSMIGGADIKEMARLDQKSAEAFITRLRDLCEAVRQFPAPVIARLPGWCLGGGLEVAAACDFRIAAHDAKFGMPEVRVGIPSVIHAALVAAADRLGPRPLAGHDGGKYRRADRARLGPGRYGGASKAASMPRSSIRSRRCSNAARKRCARRRRCCGNGKNCR